MVMGSAVTASASVKLIMQELTVRITSCAVIAMDAIWNALRGNASARQGGEAKTARLIASAKILTAKLMECVWKESATVKVDTLLIVQEVPVCLSYGVQL